MGCEWRSIAASTARAPAFLLGDTPLVRYLIFPFKALHTGQLSRNAVLDTGRLSRYAVICGN
jgi:hypothetical protein